MNFHSNCHQTIFSGDPVMDKLIKEQLLPVSLINSLKTGLRLNYH